MADNLTELPSLGPREGLAGLVVGIKGFLVWLGGSLASITAIFYATGYLITRAHMSMLGLHGVIDVDNHDIVQEGGKFFLVAGYSTLSNVALPLLVWVGSGVIAVMLLRPLLGNRAHTWWAHVCLHLAGGRARHWLRLGAFVALFMGFYCHAEAFLIKFQSPLCIGNLLYAEPGSLPCSGAMMEEGAHALRKALLTHDQSALNAAFDELAVGFALALVLAYLTWRITLPWRGHAWYTAPSLVAAGLYLILLPMDYGVLQRPVTYPRIVLTPADKDALPLNGPLFLLRQTAQEFVVWDGALRKLFWVPAGTVKRAELDGSYDLFKAAPAPAITQGKKR